METRDGLLEFRLKQVTFVNRRGVTKTKDVLQYRQCFGGIWDDWKDVPVPSKIAD